MAKGTRRISRKDAEELSAPQSPSEEQSIHKVSFDYIKSTCFRVIRVDGVHGGVTPRADGVQLAMFSERKPIPMHEEYTISEDGALGNRTDVKQRDAIVREVEVEAMLSVEVARKLEEWLHDKIKQIEQFQNKISNSG
ncbi:MAG: hypothetical protein ABFD90_21475 [Phycisphaerales bacterium]